jgi:CDP-diacylglycerol--glycerol-3-phosphate 3-phosphatidyltransferase
VINWPNAISLLRLLMAPLLLWLAYAHCPGWFLGILVFAGLTDVVDGFLARHLGQITELGSHLDSWGDFSIYSTMAAGAWLLWPEQVAREWLPFGAIVASFSLPVLAGLYKFGKLTSYHTWSVKLAVAVTYAGYLLLFAGCTPWLFRLAAVFCVVAGIEEILITLVMKKERADVRSLRAALRGR